MTHIERLASIKYQHEAFGAVTHEDKDYLLTRVKVLTEAATLNVDWDCGDNSCRFAKKKGGMRTNGGCRCLENFGKVHSSTIKRFVMRCKAVVESEA